MSSDVFFLSLALIEISFYQRLLEYTICGFQGTYRFFSEANGDGEIRTLDPLLARQVLSQLSYTPIWYHQLTLTTLFNYNLAATYSPMSSPT